jgi:hypothetical protein
MDPVPAQPATTRPGLVGLATTVVGVALLFAPAGAYEWSMRRARDGRAAGNLVQPPPTLEATLVAAGLYLGGLTTLVGLGLCAQDLRRPPRTRAACGLAVGLVGGALYVVWVLLD